MAGFLNAVSASAGGQVDISAPSITPSGSNRLLLASITNMDATPGTGTNVITSDVDGDLTDEYAIQVFNTYIGHLTAATVAPTASAQVITYERDAQYGIAISVATFEDVDQSTPTDTWAFDTGVNCAISVSSATDDLVYSILSADDNAIEVAGDLTSRAEEENFSSTNQSHGIGTAAGATTVDADWTNAAGSYGAGSGAVNINNASGGGGPTGSNLLTTLGVG